MNIELSEFIVFTMKHLEGDEQIDDIKTWLDKNYRIYENDMKDREYYIHERITDKYRFVGTFVYSIFTGHRDSYVHVYKNDGTFLTEERNPYVGLRKLYQITHVINDILKPDNIRLILKNEHKDIMLSTESQILNDLMNFGYTKYISSLLQEIYDIKFLLIERK